MAVRDPATLSLSQIENIERISLRAFFLAALDFGKTAWEMFKGGLDDPKDIAEDTTRDMLEDFGGYQGKPRIFGTVDYRKARRVLLPRYGIEQALLVDSKAEKTSHSATLQLSQTSLRIRQVRGGNQIDEPGLIKPIEIYDSKNFLTTTLFGHYCYSSQANGGRDTPPYSLKRLTLIALPNGLLQSRYNPDPETSFWLAGRNSPKRGEDFRVRVSFAELSSMASWRVQVIDYDSGNGEASGTWRQ